MREALLRIPNGKGHAGLVLDTRLRPNAKTDTDAKRDLVREVASIPVPAVYGRFLARWQAALAADPTTRVRRATAGGRVIVGLGGESVLETTITLHRTFGVPFLPGSALKGLAASYARNRLDEHDWDSKTKGGAYQILFGTTEGSGHVVFHDALPEASVKLKPDVITVHHPHYYGPQQTVPADWDSPTPIPFVTVAPGAIFNIALTGPDAWRDAAFEILALALAEEGIGAKTSSGYGRLTLEMPAAGGATAGGIVAADAGPARDLITRVEAMRPNMMAGQMPDILARCAPLPDEAKKAVSEAVMKKVDALGMRRQFQDRAWFIGFVALSE